MYVLDTISLRYKINIDKFDNKYDILQFSGVFYPEPIHNSLVHKEILKVTLRTVQLFFLL